VNGTNLDILKAKTAKREQEKKKKRGLFCGDCGDYCFGCHTNDDWIQCMERKVCFYEKCDNEKAVCFV
jgi:hypothetical protein